MPKCRAIGIALALVTLASGCASPAIRKIEAPEAMPVLASSYTADQKGQDVALYTDLVSKRDFNAARVVRDVIVQSVKKEIGIVYYEFERNLFANKAAFEVQTDIFELLLSTATTLTTGQRARTNLSALLTGTKGTRLSVDKNVFGERTYSTIVSQMRAARSRVSASIYEKLAELDVAKYPLAEAEHDLVELFTAGTIHEALVELSIRAGADAEAEKKNEAEKARIKIPKATADEVSQIFAVRGRFNALVAKKDLAAARKVLKTLEPATRDDLPDGEVWKKLDASIQRAFEDKSFLPTLVKAFAAS